MSGLHGPPGAGSPTWSAIDLALQRALHTIRGTNLADIESDAACRMVCRVCRRAIGGGAMRSVTLCAAPSARRQRPTRPQFRVLIRGDQR